MPRCRAVFIVSKLTGNKRRLCSELIKQWSLIRHITPHGGNSQRQRVNCVFVALLTAQWGIYTLGRESLIGCHHPTNTPQFKRCWIKHYFTVRGVFFEPGFLFYSKATKSCRPHFNKTRTFLCKWKKVCNHHHLSLMPLFWHLQQIVWDKLLFFFYIIFHNLIPYYGKGVAISHPSTHTRLKSRQLFRAIFLS